MSETFSAITYEVYISGAWTDITVDVRLNPSVRWSCGILGNKLTDRVGWAGYLTFSLDNTSGNSAGLAGYYSPGHTNALSGWGVGVKVRLSFTWDGATRVKFIGRVLPDGITVAPGYQSGSRDVRVRCGDFMHALSVHELSLPEFVEDKTMDEIVALIVANLPIQPENTSYSTGTDTFPSVFDTVRVKTTGASELYKVALSEFAPVYCRSDGTLVTESRTTRSNVTNTQLPLPADESDFLLAEDGTFLLAEDGTKIVLNETQEADFDNTMVDMQLRYGANYANRVIGTSYPRKVDAAATTVLVTLQKPFQLAAGETKTGYRLSYRDPAGAATRVSGRDMVTPAATTDYTANDASDGSGTDRTGSLTVTASYGTEAVEYTLVNGHSGDIWVTKLQARGKGIYIYDPVQVIHEDSGEQAANGVYTLVFDMKYQDRADLVDSFSAYALQLEKVPGMTVDEVTLEANRNSMNMSGFMYLEPGTKAHFTETQSGIDKDFFIQGYSAEIVNGKTVFWKPVLLDASRSSFWILGTSRLGYDTTLSFPV